MLFLLLCCHRRTGSNKISFVTIHEKKHCANLRSPDALKNKNHIKLHDLYQCFYGSFEQLIKVKEASFISKNKFFQRYLKLMILKSQFKFKK